MRKIAPRLITMYVCVPRMRRSQLRSWGVNTRRGHFETNAKLDPSRKMWAQPWSDSKDKHRNHNIIHRFMGKDAIYDKDCAVGQLIYNRGPRGQRGHSLFGTSISLRYKMAVHEGKKIKTKKGLIWAKKGSSSSPPLPSKREGTLLPRKALQGQFTWLQSWRTRETTGKEKEFRNKVLNNNAVIIKLHEDFDGIFIQFVRKDGNNITSMRSLKLPSTTNVREGRRKEKETRKVTPASSLL